MVKKIDNIMFFVKDLEKSSKFYEEVLGLKVGWKDEKRKMVGFLMANSDSEIVIHSDPSLPKFDYSFQVESVENFIKDFESKGGVVLKRPFGVRCGKFAVLQDLDGNVFPIIDLTAFGGVARYD